MVKEEMNEQIRRFETALASKHYTDPQQGYRPYVDIASFVDYFLIQEFTKNIDGFRRSVFFYRGTDGKFHMGPLWDFDIALGNLSFFGMEKPTGWSHSKFWVVFPKVFWFERMLKDPYFKHLIKTRYFELRQAGNLLDWNQLELEIDELDETLNQAPQKDQCRWAGTRNFFVRHFMNTRERSDSYEGNVVILKNWIQARLKWLDKQIAEEKF